MNTPQNPPKYQNANTDTDSKKAPTLQESLQAFIENVPAEVKDFLLEKKYVLVATTLTQRYELQTKQTTVLENELLLMLIGVENPQEVSNVLINNGFDKNNVDNIMHDIEIMVFSPLQEKMRIQHPIQNIEKPIQQPQTINQPLHPEHLTNRDISTSPKIPLVKEYAVDPYREPLE